MVRGFMFFALMSSISICITTVFYVGLTRVAARLGITNSHPGGLGVPLACQLVAILLGVGFNYALNKEFTWPQQQ